MGAIAYSLQQSWFQIILPDDQRRLIAPRLGGITLGIGSVILLPIAFTIDGLVTQCRHLGLWHPAPDLRRGRHRPARRPAQDPVARAHPRTPRDAVEQRCAGTPATAWQRDDPCAALGGSLAVPVGLRHRGSGHRRRVRHHPQRDQLGNPRARLALRQLAPSRRLRVAPAAPVVPAPRDGALHRARGPSRQSVRAGAC